MNSESVDLIYLRSDFQLEGELSRVYGSPSQGAEFKDIWILSDLNAEGINLIKAKHPNLYRVFLASMADNDEAYLGYMVIRIIEMKRLLKPTGSIY